MTWTDSEADLRGSRRTKSCVHLLCLPQRFLEWCVPKHSAEFWALHTSTMLWQCLWWDMKNVTRLFYLSNPFYSLSVILALVTSTILNEIHRFSNWWLMTCWCYAPSEIGIFVFFFFFLICACKCFWPAYFLSYAACQGDPYHWSSKAEVSTLRALNLLSYLVLPQLFF